MAKLEVYEEGCVLPKSPLVAPDSTYAQLNKHATRFVRKEAEFSTVSLKIIPGD